MSRPGAPPDAPPPAGTRPGRPCRTWRRSSRPAARAAARKARPGQRCVAWRVGGEFGKGNVTRHAESTRDRRRSNHRLESRALYLALIPGMVSGTPTWNAGLERGSEAHEPIGIYLPSGLPSRLPSRSAATAQAPAPPPPIGPNPRLRLDPALGVVVMEFLDQAGKLRHSAPTEEQLRAYRPRRSRR